MCETFDIKQFDKENITYHGEFVNFDFSPKDYDVFLYTSETDGMPNVILEAMAAKIPVITHNSGGVKEVAHNCAGLVVDQLDNILGYVSYLNTFSKFEDVEDVSKDLQIESALQNIEAQHTWSAFIDSVRDCEEYIK